MDDPPSAPGDLFGVLKSSGGLLLGLSETGAWPFGPLVTAILVLFLLSFLFSGLEAGLFSFGRYRFSELCANGNKRALRLAKLFEHPGSLVSTLVILNVTVNVILTALWTSGAISLSNSISFGSTAVFVTISEIVLLVLIVLFAEITPKALFTKYAEPISLTFAPFIGALYTVVGPIRWILEGIAHILLLSFRAREKGASNSVTEEELLGLVTVGEHEGVIDSHEREMIHSIFEFGDRQVSEVMVPRIDIIAVEENSNLRGAMSVIVSSGYSRIPIYAETIDTIVGILMAKDILPLIGRGGINGISIKEVMRKNVLFIPETKPLKELFEEFQRRKIYMAIAVEEYGGTAGLITTEDMLEEIVGEIADEHDTVQPLIDQQPDGSYILEGKFPLHELEELFEVEIEDQDCDTAGGLILDKLGCIPDEGQVICDSSLCFQVLEVDGHRITRIRAWRVEDTQAGGEGA